MVIRLQPPKLSEFMVKHEKFERIPKEQRVIHYSSDRLTLKKGCQFIREIGNKIGLYSQDF